MGARTADGLVEDEVHRASFDRTSVGARVAVRTVPSATWASTLGTTPTASDWVLLFVAGGFLAILLSAGFIVPIHWYDSKVKDAGSGRLPPRSREDPQIPSSDLEHDAEPISSSRSNVADPHRGKRHPPEG